MLLKSVFCHDFSSFPEIFPRTFENFVSLQVLILDKNVYWNYREDWENR